ncbi:citrate lyase subunit beta / citryl-CoA lyase [Burkholderia sp. WP9]|uniref:HpcH/HpaI aldolase/citrate lyase family protein n=1 Tax=Burkholderia sp. WP9 TaxID=1500263 RepID=UPI000899AA37|nr:aldolase/citrate lyase family protein [Burkholderia sp. WP9]SEE91844.1 citrate lyase subunit beta / citryl-CoA lyase [Burkholderia sp. WP9]
MNAHPTPRPPGLRRTWLFAPGNNSEAHAIALQSGADAIVVDLEEMTSLQDRPRARERIVALLREAARAGTFGSVRINKLEHDGHADLEGIMPGAPRAIFLPHAESTAQLASLDDALAIIERKLGIPAGSTEVVPVIESAKGLVNLGALLQVGARIKCCMLAVEDLAANLGARRTPGGIELLYARNRFLIESIAAGCVPIDLPCTYRSAQVLGQDLDLCTQLGFASKSVVFAEHVPAIHRALTPSAEDVRAAHALIHAHAAQQANPPDAGSAWIDYPERNNAQRLIARDALLRAFDDSRNA